MTIGIFKEWLVKYFFVHKIFQKPFLYFNKLDYLATFAVSEMASYVFVNRQTSGESTSLPQYLGCNTVFDMRLRVTFLRRKTVSFNQALRTANKF